jgi:hypothetical protein
MKYTKIFILLLVLISSYFALQVINDKESIENISKITTKTVLKIQAKAAAVFASLSINVITPLNIYIISPLNKTYNYNNSIELNFTISGEDLDKTYYNIDNGDNITITGNTTFSVSSNSAHILNLFANTTSGQSNSSSVTFGTNLSLPWNITFTKFGGGTTNFSALNKSQQHSIPSVIIENPSYDKVSFTDIHINREINLNNFINLSYNRVEIDGDNLPEFNKPALLYLYNITFTNPRPLRDGGTCPLVCNKINFSNNIFVFNVTGFSVYSSEETPSEGGTVSVSGGGGGSAGPSGKTLSDFIVDKSLIKVSLLPGETKREGIGIENVGKSDLNLQIDLENIKDLLMFPGGLSKYSLKLKPGEKQILQLIFNTPKDYKPGIYLGKIIINSQLSSTIITTLIEVEDIRKIFDIQIKLPNKQIIIGGELVAEIILINLRRETGIVDTQVEFGIKDLKGNVIQKEDSRIAVETQASFTESMIIPEYLNVGQYVAYAIVKFDNQIGVASEIFEVISAPHGFMKLSTLYIYIIPGFISIIVILIILEFLKHHYKKKILIKKEPPIITRIQKPREKFDINKFLKEIEGGVVMGHIKEFWNPN